MALKCLRSIWVWSLIAVIAGAACVTTGMVWGQIAWRQEQAILAEKFPSWIWMPPAPPIPAQVLVFGGVLLLVCGSVAALYRLLDRFHFRR
jgi:hypothetical protein